MTTHYITVYGLIKPVGRKVAGYLIDDIYKTEPTEPAGADTIVHDHFNSHNSHESIISGHIKLEIEDGKIVSVSLLNLT